MKHKYRLLNLVVVGLLGASSAWAGLVGHGGVTGGGGNSRTSGFLSIEEVSAYIIKSKTDVLLASRLVGHLYLGHQDKFPASFAKVFGQPEIIETALDQLKIRIKTGGPCYGSDGSFNDGWFDPAVPNEICISAQSLASKVPASEVKSQTMALILHEVSHSLGLNEADATALQDMMLKYAYISQDLTHSYPYESVYALIQTFNSRILKSAEQLRHADFSNQCQFAKALSEDVAYLAAEKVFLTNSGLLFETHMSFKYVGLLYKLQAFTLASCYLQNPADPKLNKFYQNYLKMFAHFGKDRLTMSEFAASQGLGLRYDVVDVKIPLIKTLDDANAEAAGIADLVKELSLDVEKTLLLVRRSFKAYLEP